MPQLTLANDFATSSATVKPQLGRQTSQNLRGAMPALLKIARGAVATPAGNVTVWGANVPNPWANRANAVAFRQRTDVTDANLVAADYQFLSTIPFAAFANYNWIALLDEFEEFVLEIGTSLGGAITSGTGALARLDFTAENKTGDGATTAFTLLSDFSTLTHCNLQVKLNGVIQATTAYTLTANAAGKIVITWAVAPGNTLVMIHQFYPKPGKTFGLALVTPVTVKAALIQVSVDEEVITRDALWLVTGAGVTGTITATVKALGTGG